MSQRDPAENDLVEPGEVPIREDLVRRLLRAGATRRDAEWLIDAIDLACRQYAEATGERERAGVERFMEQISAAAESVLRDEVVDYDLKTLRLLTLLPGWVWDRLEADRLEIDVESFNQAATDLCRDLVASFRRHDPERDLTAALPPLVPDVTPHGSARDRYRADAVVALTEAGLVAPHRLVSLDRVRAATEMSWSVNFDEPREIVFWLDRFGPIAIRWFLPAFQLTEEDCVGIVALGVLAHVEAWRTQGRLLSEGGPLDRPIALELRPYFDRVRAIVNERAEDAAVLGVYWRLFSKLLRDAPDVVDEAARQDALELADRLVGTLRAKVRAGASRQPDTRYTGAGRDSADDVSVLADLGGTWAALKGLLLAFRELKSPAVPADLRTWPEPGLDPLPPEWNWLPATIAGVIHGSARRERSRDATLSTVRKEFAQFCLSRLHTRRKVAETGSRIDDADFVEPSWIWRRCYLRAIRELGVNPDRKGHRVLHWLAQHDPSDTVKREAKLAYVELRKKPAPGEDISPRRRLLAAFWWLRQAHLLSLGFKVDPQGARRTRQVEARHTGG